MNLYETKSYEETTGVFRGIVVGSDDRPVIWTKETYKKDIHARRYANLAFQDALYKCVHEWDEWTEEHAEDTAFGGTEYISSCDCKRCGLRNYNIADRPTDF